MFDMLSSDRRTARFMILPARCGADDRDRHQDQRQAGQPPVEPEGAGQAAHDPERLADHPAQDRHQALLDRLHVVGEPGQQLGRALVVEAGQVQGHRPAEEQVADVEEGELGQVGDEDFLEEQEEPLAGRSRP